MVILNLRQQIRASTGILTILQLSWQRFLQVFSDLIFLI